MVITDTKYKKIINFYKKLSTRNAVETAIDLSKSKESYLESLVNHFDKLNKR